MANTFILVSSAIFGAIAVPTAGSRLSFLRRLFGKRASSSEMMAPPAPPTINTDHGWTMIHCDDPESFSQWLGRDSQGLPFGDEEEPSLGSHLLVELYGCDGDALKAETEVGTAMRDAATESKATVVAQSFHEFKPYGVSGAVIIQESHYTIHTWPEHGYAAVDLFYCGGGVQVHRALDVLQQRFKPARIKFLVIRRGMQHEVSR